VLVRDGSPTHLGAVVAAKDLAIDLNAVADHVAVAVAALGRQRVDRTLEAVEDVLAVFAVHDDFK
jgi:hypothetical protein